MKTFTLNLKPPAIFYQMYLKQSDNKIYKQTQPKYFMQMQETIAISVMVYW